MDKLFLDTNVIFNVLEKRAPWYPESTECLARIRNGLAKGAMTALSLSDTAYIHTSTPSALLSERFQTLRKFIEIAPLTSKTVDIALAMNSPDLEDNYQYAAALNRGASHLVTRNKKDFPAESMIPVLTPTEYLRDYPK